MTQPLPESLKAWIEKEAQKLFFNNASSLVNRYGLKDGFVNGATSLYNHLKGLPDERDKEIEALKNVRNVLNDNLLTTNQNYHEAIKEIEMLKGLIELITQRPYEDVKKDMKEGMNKLNNL